MTMEKIKVDLDIMSSDEILEEMYREYLTCPKAIKYLAALGLSDEQIRANIAKVYDFVSDIKYCEKCPGVDNCQKSNPLFCTKITYKNGFIDREVAPCKKLFKRIQFQNQFLIRDFGDEYLDSKLKDVDDIKEKNLVLEKYNKFIQDKINNWFYLTGSQNVGKSFLATVIAVDIAKRSLGPIIFANSTRRIGELVDYYYKDKERFKREIDRYCNVPVLILDDLGNEVVTEAARDAIIFQILSSRASKRLFTIITSDFVVDDLVQLYSTSKSGAIRAKQIGSIIKNIAGKEINLGDIVTH